MLSYKVQLFTQQVVFWVHPTFQALGWVPGYRAKQDLVLSSSNLCFNWASILQESTWGEVMTCGPRTQLISDQYCPFRRRSNGDRDWERGGEGFLPCCPALLTAKDRREGWGGSSDRKEVGHLSECPQGWGSAKRRDKNPDTTAFSPRADTCPLCLSLDLVWPFPADSFKD